MKTQEKSPENNKVKHTSSTKEIKSDLPVSEKDEVKSAERRMRKRLKDHL